MAHTPPTAVTNVGIRGPPPKPPTTASLTAAITQTRKPSATWYCGRRYIHHTVTKRRNPVANVTTAWVDAHVPTHVKLSPGGLAADSASAASRAQIP
jgi:hypothetical protein